MKLDDVETGAFAQRTFLDSFLEISRTYLQSAERLSALNMAVIRETVTDGAAVVDSLAGATSVGEVQEITSAMDVLMIDRALDYARGVQETAAETHTGICSLMQKNFHNSVGMGTSMGC